MIDLDLGTVILMIFISSILQLVVLCVFACFAKEYRGLFTYSLGMFIFFLGYLGIFINNTILSRNPNFTWFIVLNNCLMVGSILFYGLGMCKFLKTRFYYTKWILFFVIFGIGQFYLTYEINSYFLRNVLISLFSITIYMFMMINLVQTKAEGFRAVADGLIIVLIVIILFFGFRIFALLSEYTQSPSEYTQSPIDPTLANRVGFLVVFILEFLRNLFFVLMVINKMYFDLKKSSKTDFLTQLLNRRALTDLIQNFIKKKDKSFSVILLDIDHFKKINDTYGHDVGDLVLKQVADLLQSQMNPPDLLGRWGGEEFLIFCPEYSRDILSQRLENLRSQVEMMVIHTPQGVIHCTISLGIASTVMGYDNFEELLKSADLALYRAKKNGRNRFEWGHFFSDNYPI
ncbi:GGDEF domain-containing protein [Spirulina subsalsa FACHB-351]|uniref:GGDEF domain-containing protein n=1 Tax=Spirulina subsalsa FACHB-351 TaxID=234711 RepID=A0ABT3LBZ4_9CYAN|nr:GGDEF domain-containing protein [Spirulina subsalsa]MCW6038652.1 GGDEF domain-containing protein [Spirulina subsalsa FACHB-351]